ncbi:MAG TPA: tRNA lysidine(34) synthetase TilS [Saprospiraceae bacterium]|nr:tRNA lysidine(34) synthetase TilS [Saprospiraceae bacterium]
MQDQFAGPKWKEAVKRCTDFLATVGVILDQKHILLAVSGGKDSMCMLALLVTTRARVSVAHVNYGLRGADSDADTGMVREACNELGVVLHEKRFDLTLRTQTNDESLQQLGRRLRYAWFEELSTSHQYDYICTAHHQDDAAESFFINLMRGTGLKGLMGIPVLRGNIIRPMLCFTRAEIGDLVQQYEIRYREDASNLGRDYLRNRIRHDIIPLFKGERAHFITRMHATQQRLHDEYVLLEDYLIRLKSELCNVDRGTFVVDRERLFMTTSPAIVLLYFIQQYGFSWAQCMGIVKSTQTSGTIYLSHSHRLVVDRNRICVVPSSGVHDEESIQVEGDGQYVLSDGELIISHADGSTFNGDPNIEFVDASKLPGPFIVRHWRAGDFFYPLGGPGRQKLQDYFTNQKNSVLDKQQVWLLTAGEDIVWVIGMRLDNRYRITAGTTHVIRLEWRPSDV